MENDDNQDIVLENNEETVEEETTSQPVAEEEDTTDWKAEALKNRAILERQKRKSTTIIRREDDDLKPLKEKVDKLELADRKYDFGHEHGLSRDEVEAVFKLNPNPTKEDLENPFVKGGLEALRAKRRVESSTPSPSSATPKFEGKDYEELTPEEKQENRDKFLKSKIGQLKRS